VKLVFLLLIYNLYKDTLLTTAQRSTDKRDRKQVKIANPKLTTTTES